MSKIRTILTLVVLTSILMLSGCSTQTVNTLEDDNSNITEENITNIEEIEYTDLYTVLDVRETAGETIYNEYAYVSLVLKK